VCDLLENMKVEIKDAFVEDVIADKKEGEEEQVLVGLEVDNPAILIGFKGRNLSCLQFMMSLMVKKELDSWVRILLDINGYRGEQEKRLEERTKEVIEQVLKTGEARALMPMSSFERRICHVVVAATEGVISESEGEGYERKVVIKPEVKEEVKKKVKKKKTVKKTK
jgi:spoIIIJ-associated protein